jgi:hypothetical protein
MITYTAIVGNIDRPRDDILCFSGYDKFKMDVRNAKIYKILAHQFLDTDISLWLDGNIFLNVTQELVAEELLGDADMGLFKHFARDCIYEEGVASAGKYPKEEIQSEIFDHLDYYKQKKYPFHNGLYECGVLLRRHSKKMEEFNNAWWSEICQHSFRDQISLPYVLSKFPDLKIKITEGNVRKHNFFKYINHQ